MPPPGWKKLSAEEQRLASEWFDDDMDQSEIARLLGRDKSTVTRHCVKQVVRKKQGRPEALTQEQVDFLLNVCVCVRCCVWCSQ